MTARACRRADPSARVGQQPVASAFGSHTRTLADATVRCARGGALRARARARGLRLPLQLSPTSSTTSRPCATCVRPAALPVGGLRPLLCAAARRRYRRPHWSQGEEEAMLRVLAVGACLGALAGALCVAGTARAAFPGANGLIAFQVNATTSDGSFIEHIYVVEPDGTGLRDLSTVSAPDGLVLDANPAWSPDGTKIAFDSNRGGSGATHVFVMNANGTGVHQITGQPGSDPAWSPDGNRLAFVRDGNILFRDLTTGLV